MQMQETPTTTEAATAEKTTAMYVPMPGRWLKFTRRFLGLKPGRYVIHLSVHPDNCDWTVQDVGKIER